MHVSGGMLRLARQRRGFQQTEAARRLGIDQPLLSRIENGLSEPRDELLNSAAQAYDVPRSFFFQTDPIYGAPVSLHPMWRKKAEVSARDLDTVVAELNIRLMHIRRLLEGADLVNTSDLPRLDLDDYGSPARIAGILRAHWRIPSGPLPDLTRLAEKAGVIVAHSSLGGATVSGVTFATPGMPPLIALNSDQPSDRMRFTLAHELGHLVMHRFPTPRMEEEANEFASALLLPATDIKPYFRGRRVALALLAALKPEWRVSMGALLMAASEHAPLEQNQKQYLWKQMSARGYRLREPPELDFARELPTVVSSLIDVHLDAMGYTADELAGLFSVHGHELAAYYPTKLEQPKAKFTVLK